MRKEPMPPPHYGMIAQFSEAEDLMKAARKARETGYEKVEAYTPYAIEGLVDVLGNRDDRVPWVVFWCGVIGASLGFLMQCWISMVDFPMNVGGRPNFSWPLFISITFECGILSAAFGAVIGMLVMNGLPLLHHPLFAAPNFESVSRDKFFLCIESSDPKYDRNETRKFLEELGAETVSEVNW